MINSGDIVYFNYLIFRNNQIDNKKNRPCVVLAVDEKNMQVICVPLTSQIKSFNKYNYKYCLIPTIIYDYHKMNFASLDNLVVKNLTDAYETGITINSDVVERIINKISDNPRLCDVETLAKLKENQEIEKQKEKMKQMNVSD